MPKNEERSDERPGVRTPAAILAALPWPSDVERVREQVRWARTLTSEERFRAQCALLKLVDPAVRSAGAQWHDLQEAIQRERLLEVFRRHVEE